MFSLNIRSQRRVNLPLPAPSVPAAYYEQALDILDDEGSIDIDERADSWRQEGWTG